MSETPERIWATVNGLRTGMPGAHSWLIGGWEARAKQSERETEYVRKDLFDAVKAERDNYKALYEAERDDELLNIARQAGYQDGAEERRKLEARVKALTAAEALVAECDIYLKEGETPRQRMDRDHLDILALGKMLADDRKRRDEAEARVKALTEALRFYADDAWIDRPPPQPSPEEVAVFGSNILTLGMPEILYDNGERARAALQENTDDR